MAGASHGFDVAESVADALDNGVMRICERLKSSRKVAALFTNRSLTDFKGDLRGFIEQGLEKGSSVLFSEGDVPSRLMEPLLWQFGEEDIDELAAMVIQAFQMPVSLGDDVFCAAMGHLQRMLAESNDVPDVLRRLRGSLDAEVTRQKGLIAAAKAKRSAAKAVPKRPASPKRRGIGKVQDTRSAPKTQEARPKEEVEARNDQIPKAPDCLEVIGMASRLLPRMDIEDVREVQRMVSTDLGEILREAREFGYQELQMDSETIKSIHFMWMLFCHDRGGSQKAEDAVCKRLRKMEPALALMLYGPQALMQVDARGMRVKKGKGSDRDHAIDDYMALGATLDRLKVGGGEDKAGHQCGVSGLLRALFGEFDYSALVTELLAGLSPDAKKRLIQSLAAKAEEGLSPEELKELKELSPEKLAVKGGF